MSAPYREIETKWVRAPGDCPCAMENNSHRYITKDTSVEVPCSSYYIRRLMQGDLVEVAPPSVKKGSDR